jgi:soluble lytic murein transglycosylase-like protein
LESKEGLGRIQHFTLGSRFNNIKRWNPDLTAKRVRDPPMNRLTLAPFFLLLAILQAPAQDLKDYLRIRRSYGIVESVGVPALETLVGTRVFEVQGVIKGTLRVGNKLSVLLERTDGESQQIDAAKIPDWAIGTEVSARLIVRATRTDENSELHATLIAVAQEEDVRPIEEALMAANAKVAKTRHRASAKLHTSSPKQFTVSAKAPTRRWFVPSDQATPYYAVFIQKHNPRLSYSEAYRIATGVIGFSKRYGVDAQLIVAMVICESDFNPREVSNKGAMGLGQLMPETVQDYGITNPFDSIQNLYGTVREIRSHIDKYRGETGDEYQSLVLGLAAYNAGEGAVRRHGGVPPYRETQAYVRKVINLYYHLLGYR